MKGIGAGLFGHATLTATIRKAPKGRIGLSLGAWGAVQATCAGIGVLLAGLIRDALVATSEVSGHVTETPYNIVFGIEAVFLIAAVIVAVQFSQRRHSSTRTSVGPNEQPNPVEVS